MGKCGERRRTENATNHIIKARAYGGGRETSVLRKHGSSSLGSRDPKFTAAQKKGGWNAEGLSVLRRFFHLLQRNAEDTADAFFAVRDPGCRGHQSVSGSGLRDLRNAFLCGIKGPAGVSEVAAGRSGVRSCAGRREWKADEGESDPDFSSFRRKKAKDLPGLPRRADCLPDAGFFSGGSEKSL